MQERECPFMSKIVNEVGVTTEVISCSKQKSTNFCHPESKEVAEDKCMDQHELVAIVLAVSNQRISHIFRRQLYSFKKLSMENKTETKIIHSFFLSIGCVQRKRVDAKVD